MRRPTPEAETLTRWRAAVENRAAPIVVNMSRPECGAYRAKLVRGGPWVPARIYLAQEIDPATGELVADERLVCEVNGSEVDIDRWWPWIAGEPIPVAEWKYLEALRRHTEQHEPTHPAARPRESLDPLKTPIPF